MRFKNIYLVIIFAVLILVLLSSYISAALLAPTGLVISRNTTSEYDEGSFDLNWTAISIGPVDNYDIYVYADGILFRKATNNSVTGFAYSNTTEANYTFKVAGVNATDSVEGANSTNISMYIDRTGPLISLPIYTNATAKQNSASLTLNISVSDALSGLTGSYCILNSNSTNQTVAVNDGWCNLTNLGLTGLTDGNHTIKVYVNDTVGALSLNNSFVVQADTTAPTGTFGCSPSSVYQGATVTCTCTPSDATSGINSSRTSYTSNPSTSSVGTFSQDCVFYDYAGNSKTLTDTYGVADSSSSGGGTSGSGNEWSYEKTKSWAKMISGGENVMSGFSSDMAVQNLSFDVKKNVTNVKVDVKKYDSKPSTVLVARSGKIYQYFQIDVQNLGDNLNLAVLNVKIKKTWASNNDLGKEDITIYKFDESSDKWNELITNYVNEDNDYLYYSTNLSSFSYFAIGDKNSISDEETTNSPSSTSGDEGEETTSETEENTSWWVWVVILVIIIAIVLGRPYIKEKLNNS